MPTNPFLFIWTATLAPPLTCNLHVDVLRRQLLAGARCGRFRIWGLLTGSSSWLIFNVKQLWSILKI
jgi:hypothetical protein